jgi:hypothetical protein
MDRWRTPLCLLTAPGRSQGSRTHWRSNARTALSIDTSYATCSASTGARRPKPQVAQRDTHAAAQQDSRGPRAAWAAPRVARDERARLERREKLGTALSSIPDPQAEVLGCHAGRAGPHQSPPRMPYCLRLELPVNARRPRPAAPLPAPIRLPEIGRTVPPAGRLSWNERGPTSFARQVSPVHCRQ